MSLSHEYDDLVDSYQIGHEIKGQIKDTLRKIGEHDLRWINLHLFIAAYRMFVRTPGDCRDKAFMDGLDSAYELVSHLCRGRDKERVKRSILRYYYYIKSIKGYALF